MPLRVEEEETLFDAAYYARSFIVSKQRNTEYFIIKKVFILWENIM